MEYSLLIFSAVPGAAVPARRVWGREPPRDEPRGPKRKKEKPREVKIL